MRARTWALALVTAAAAVAAAGPTPARGQDHPSADQMKKMYDEAVVQLKAAQERKNQLAAENEKLGQQLEALRKESAAAAARLDELRRADAEHAEKTFYLRAHYVAWQQFVRQSPETDGRWRTFLEGSYPGMAGREPTELLDRSWPIPSPATSGATTTAPTTLPTTGPTAAPATGPAAAPAAGPAAAPAATQSAVVPQTQPVQALPQTPPPQTQPAGTQPATAPAGTRPAGTTPTTGPATRPALGVP